MGFLESLGRQTLSIFHQLGAVILLLMAAVREISAIRGRETCRQCLSLGVLSFPIVALTLLFTGMVLSVQIAGELTKYGADFTVGAIVAIGIGRELGPVLCGVVLAGRVGAAITAEIGTMRVTEQIDALRCMAVSPIGYLVVPRLIACMCMLPLLDVFGVAIGVGGGMMVAIFVPWGFLLCIHAFHSRVLRALRFIHRRFQIGYFRHDRGSGGLRPGHDLHGRSGRGR